MWAKFGGATHAFLSMRRRHGDVESSSGCGGYPQPSSDTIGSGSGSGYRRIQHLSSFLLPQFFQNFGDGFVQFLWDLVSNCELP